MVTRRRSFWEQDSRDGNIREKEKGDREMERRAFRIPLTNTNRYSSASLPLPSTFGSPAKLALVFLLCITEDETRSVYLLSCRTDLQDLSKVPLLFSEVGPSEYSSFRFETLHLIQNDIASRTWFPKFVKYGPSFIFFFRIKYGNLSLFLGIHSNSSRITAIFCYSRLKTRSIIKLFALLVFTLWFFNFYFILILNYHFSL